MKYDVTISCTITKQDGRIFFDGTNMFGGIDAEGAIFFQKADTDMQTYTHAVSGASGKTYTIAAGMRVVGEDGVVIKDGTRVIFLGVPYSGIVGAEERLMQLGFDLGVRGKNLAANKHKHDQQL
jgi:hypothetical protein